MRQMKMYDFTLADQDWIGLMIFKNFADQDRIRFNFIGSGLDSDWKISQSAYFWCLEENWMLDTVFLSFEKEALIWLFRHHLNFLLKLNFIGQ